MKPIQIYYFLIWTVGLLLFPSCSSGNLYVSNVGYQSVRTDFAQPTLIPSDAKIQVLYTFSSDGKIIPVIFNLTDEILTIDQTKTFFINTDGQSFSYYDPNIVVNSTTETNTNTQGGAFNWGAAASALGIGGGLGTILSGITSTQSSSYGVSNTSAVYLRDTPVVSIGPHGSGALSKEYKITGFGISNLLSPGLSNVQMNSLSSIGKFSVCVSYSFDNGTTYDKLITNFYINSSFTIACDRGNVSKGIESIYTKKPDALAESLFMIHVASNISGQTTYLKGGLVDYK
ncbi:MAG: hypothetical protein K2H60_05325 [Muribaculaceae bacterium]|nr:hypothetical protein [Muribaculaceae bacterium]